MRPGRNVLSGRADGEVLTYSIVRYLSVPLALWWAYLYINDLRYNFGHLKEQSLCAACVRLLRRQILRHPAAQRADRRMIWQFAACLPFFLFCACPCRPFWCSVWPLPLLLLLCMAGIVLIGLQVWLVRESRRSAAELDACWPALRPPGREGWREPLPCRRTQISTVQRSSSPTWRRVCVPHWPNR